MCLTLPSILGDFVHLTAIVRHVYNTHDNWEICAFEHHLHLHYYGEIIDKVMPTYAATCTGKIMYISANIIACLRTKEESCYPKDPRNMIESMKLQHLKV